MAHAASEKPLGFWTCWSLTVGTMIGSGIFMVPAVLAPYGLLSFGGWILAGGGSLALAFVFARLASRTTRSGGPYVYAQEAFGDLPGFLVAWCLWISFWMGIPAVAIAFVGYLTVFVPTLSGNPGGQALAALALIAALTAVNIRGLREAGFVQIVMTILKVLPLFAILGLAAVSGETANLPTFNPTATPILPALAATALITLWPFTGFEACTLPAGNVVNPQRTIPRALTFGMIAVTFIYLSATLAVMLLVPPETLARSTSPFSEAARGFGAWGPMFVAAGALVATAGTLNGVIFVAGQMPMAVALDKAAPRWLALTSKGGAPYLSLLLGATLGSILLCLNYARGLIEAFTFLIMMSTALSLFYYFLTAVVELRHAWRSARAWIFVALIACAYSLFAILGSGLEVLAWGLALTLVGVPVYYLCRRRSAAAAPA